MIAYDTICKMRLFDARRALKQQVPFAEGDVLEALQSIHQAMEMAQDIIDEGEATHTAQFAEQLKDWGIDASALPEEPYLEEVTLNFAYQFVRVMERLFVRIESYLPQEEPIGAMHVSLYSGNSAAMKKMDAAMQWKAFAPNEPLLPQLNQRIMQEAKRVQHRLHRNLDARRQTQMGVEYYVWRSSDDDKVRGSHAAYDDQIFRWDSPPPDGHPGQAYGCRCYAEPLPPLASLQERERLRNVDSPIESAYPELLFIGVGRTLWVSGKAALRGIRAVSNKVGERVAQYKAKRLALQTTKRLKDILSPNGRFIGKKGNGAKIRFIDGGENAGKRLFNRLIKDGVPEHRSNYKGIGYRLKNGDWVGYRAESKSGSSAIDLQIKNLNIEKIHF